MNDLELQRKSLPNEPGVYLFKDNKGDIIYVGKAINLKKRVSQYFLKTKYNDPFYETKIKEMVKFIHFIEFIVTENEKEAYILENIQIKKYDPPFNVRMRDSKTYPWVGLFYAEDFPRIRIIRGPEKFSQKNLFLGPYTDRGEISGILRDLRKIFPYCTCKKPVKKRTRPCIYYQLKLCPGPCMDAICKEDYLINIKQIELFLKGETSELKEQIKKKMEKFSADQNFETAAFWRDKLEAIEHSTSSQNVLLDQLLNKDIVGYHIEKDYAALIIIHIREGRITNKNPIKLDLRKKIVLKDEFLSSILEQYYQEIRFSLPDIIVIPELIEDIDILKDVLRELKDNIEIRTPIKDEEGLIRIANKNAKVMVDQQKEMEDIQRKEAGLMKKTLEDAQEILNLPDIPRIIEGFDISNIEGIDATGSMVYFLEGKPYNKYYRHYNIRSKSTPDDVAMMREVIERRYSYLLEKEYQLPDLILVDGGKGQLNAGVSVLKELGIDRIPIIGLAKRLEEIFIPGEKDSIILPKDSSILKLFQRIRDEAHRFAVRLHKKQRIKRVTGSILDDIKGVGPATRNKLLKHFGSVDGLKEANLEEISKIVGEKLGKLIKEYIK